MENKVINTVRRVWAWIAADGLLHFAVSAIIVFVFGLYMPLYAALIVSLSFGLLKEIMDFGKCPKRSDYDWEHSILHDFVCDIAGAAFGVLVCWLWLLLK